MKKYIALFWRGNPQLKDGGYETYRTYEAKSLAQARKMAEKTESKCVYGIMRLMDIVEA